MKCEAGAYAAVDAMTSCVTCPIGKFAGVGLDHCALCPGQATTRHTGSASGFACVCDVGYVRNASSCNACPPKSFTVDLNSTSMSACLCDATTYMTHDFTGCAAPCPEGMECPRGNAPPVLRQSYWADGSDTATRVYSIYRCRDSKQCLRGAAGSNCGVNRRGIGCANCAQGTVPGENGGCEACDASEIWPIILCVLGGSAVLALLVLFSRVDVAKTQLSSLSLALCLGQLPLVAQILSVFALLKITWIEPMKSFLRVVLVLNFDIEVFNFGCVLPADAPALIYFMKLIIFPVLCAVLMLIFWIAPTRNKVVIDKDTVFNAVGMLFFIFYMTLTIVSVLPFQCLRSPNGSSSLRSDPAVICTLSESKYVGMVILGVCGVLSYPVLGLACVVYVVRQYPQMMNTGQSFLLMQRYRFLFARFTVERYYYSIPVLLRGLLISFMPIVFANDAARQVVCTGFVLIVYLAAQTSWKPWRLLAPNIIDSIVCHCLVFVLCGGGIVLGGDEREKDLIQADMQVYFTVAVVCLLLPFVAVVGSHFYHGCFPWQYNAFLSHHKAGCAVGARLMKMELRGRISGNPFLDSDELDDLENVLDIVRCMSKTLTILLTAETLWRPWCAGEITMGFLNKIPTVFVAYDEYVTPTDEDLTVETLSRKWAPEAWALVSIQGVSLQDVCDAYMEIQQANKTQMKRLGYSSAGAGAFTAAVDEVVAQIAVFQNSSETKRAHADDQAAMRSAEVALIGDNTNGEAVSTVQVMIIMMRQSTQNAVVAIFKEVDTQSVALPQCAVVSFTAGVITSERFAAAAISTHLAWMHAPRVTVQAPNFIFPTKEMREKELYAHLAKATECDLSLVRDAFDPLFSILALKFAPSGNIATMMAEIDVVVKRVSSQMESAS